MAIGSERTGSVRDCTACVFTTEFVATNKKVYFVVNTTDKFLVLWQDLEEIENTGLCNNRT